MIQKMVVALAGSPSLDNPENIVGVAEYHEDTQQLVIDLDPSKEITRLLTEGIDYTKTIVVGVSLFGTQSPQEVMRRDISAKGE